MKKISIVTASYNSARTIEQTICSVLNQTYRNLEYIIIDGGSTDGTVEIIKKHADKIAFWSSEKDTGVYDAFNKGIARATGDYVQFLGSDDSLVGSDIITQVAGYLDDTIDMLSCGVMCVDEEYALERYMGNEGARNRETFKGDMIPHPGMFTKIEILRNRNFDIAYKFAADLDWFLDIYYNYHLKIKYIDEPVVFFSLDGMSSQYNLTSDQEHLKIYEKYHLIEKRNRLLREMEKKQKRAKESDGVMDRVKNYKHRIIKALNLWENYRGMRGWKKHHCSNVVCRWCKRGFE